MDRKLRVGWFGDYCFSGTGFGNVAWNVLARLAQTERYELFHMGAGIMPMTVLRSYKARIDRATTEPEKSEAEQAFARVNAEFAQHPQTEWWKGEVPTDAPFKVYCNTGDRYGRTCLLPFCEYHDLDCLIVNLDPWMSAWLPTYRKDVAGKPCPVIYYQPIDATCANDHSPRVLIPTDDKGGLTSYLWSQFYCLQEFTVFYGDWALGLARDQVEKEVAPHWPELAAQVNMRAIRHGVDFGRFHAIPKSIARRKLDIPQDAFVVGMVAANQPRKDWPAFVETMKIIGDAFPKVHFITWMVGNYPDSLDMEKLIVDFEVNATWMKFPFLRDMTPPPEYLNCVYNALDVHLLLTRGEGCGLPHLEATACAVPSFANDCYGITDYFADDLQRLPVQNYHIASPNLLMRPDTNLAAVVQRVRWVYENPEDAVKWARYCANKIGDWTWDATIPQWEQVIQDAAALKVRWQESKEAKD